MNYLNYSSRYAYNVQTIEEKPVTIGYRARIEDSACFSRLFDDLRRSTTPKEKVDFSTTLKVCYTSKEIENHKNQVVILSEDDIILWLDYLKNIIDYSYTLEKEDKYYVITLTGQLLPIEIKTLLTWVRYIYEAPYSLLLAESIMLYKLGVFPNEHIINIYSIMALTEIPLGSDHGHLFRSYFHNLYTVDSLKERMPHITQVNDLISRHHLKYERGELKASKAFEEKELAKEYSQTKSLKKLKALVSEEKTYQRYLDTYRYIYEIMKFKPSKTKTIEQFIKEICAKKENDAKEREQAD